MSEIVGMLESESNRPTLTQFRALISFMEKHPEIACNKQRLSQDNKNKKVWVELTHILHTYEGCRKTTKGWMKFWGEKRRFILTKQRHIEEGRIKCKLTQLEQRICNVCDKSNTRRKRRKVKEEPCNGEDSQSFDSHNGVFVKGEGDLQNGRLIPSEMDLKQLDMIEKMVGIMNQQASAMNQMAQSSLANSKALERIAEASHIQALAVERLVGTFENISASTHVIRNAILGIDYTLKRCYPQHPQQRQNSTLFS